MAVYEVKGEEREGKELERAARDAEMECEGVEVLRAVSQKG